MPKPVAESEEGASQRVSFGENVSGYDEDLYDKDEPLKLRPGYVTSIDPTIAPGDEEQQPEQLDQSLLLTRKTTVANVTAPQHFIEEAEAAASSRYTDDPFKPYSAKTVADNENDYLTKARKTGLYSRDEQLIQKQDQRVPEDENNVSTKVNNDITTSSASTVTKSGALNGSSTHSRPKRRWDVAANENDQTPSTQQQQQLEQRKPDFSSSNTNTQAVPIDDAQPPTIPQQESDRPAKISRWDEPVTSAVTTSVHSRWDATPTTSAGAKRSRWDKTPVVESTPGIHQTPNIITSSTPFLQDGMTTSELTNTTIWKTELDARNKPWTDEELNDLLPSDGYTILEPPAGYKPIHNAARQLLKTPSVPQTPLYVMPTEGGMSKDALGIPVDVPQSLKGISMKPEDYKNFAAVLNKNSKDEDVSEAEQVERKIMRLLLKIKNGAPSVRKFAMRQITDRAREFGAGPLLAQILTLLKSPTLEHQERHLYVKVIDRILYKLDDLVRPHVRDILVVIEPMLIDEDYYARIEGREIISNLSKVVGLATMISTMRPDIDHQNEFVRNTTARALAVVTSALGIPSMIMFLKAVCGSKKSWEARHTGIKIIQQIATLMGVAVLPHLNDLVEIIRPGLTDEQGKVRLIAAFGIASLAEASAPYGIESFDNVLKPLWDGIRLHRGKTLAAFLEAIGFIIPLMDSDHANYYAREVNHILIREFKSPDDDMKSVVLKVVTQCVSCSGVDANYVREEVAPEYFRCFWIRRMALDRRNFKAVVDTTLTIAKKIGGAYVIGRLVADLKDPSDPYRRMVVETVEKITESLGLSDVDSTLEAQLVDGLMFAFQEDGNTQDPCSALKALSVVIEKLGIRAKPYMEQIIGVVKWRLNNKNTKTREQAADLISSIASVLKACEEDVLISHMGTVLFEYLGEEFPDVLGSILRAMKSIIEVIGIEDMQPAINELLPRLTPILKNRHEKVQENCIVLVGMIANKGARYVSPKEWMRICFELLELLKAPRKAIRKSAVATFGYISKAIGPSNVLVPLLNNLKVQERTQRVCTTVAIAIVAETCQPYTILPSLMNEYRIPELHVQNGILKSLSFLFEYIGPMAGDYIYAVTPMLEDALVDRDLVHRQTSCSAVGHLALGVRGLGVEDALIHLLNHVWPNIFETSPHVINAVMAAIQGCAVALGPAPILLYLLHGLFHPAKKVREVYWRIYNALYIHAQDGLVPCYPNVSTVDIEEGGENDQFGSDRYERHELFLML